MTEKKSSRTVVSVSFTHDDLNQVVEAARGAGMKMSEFVRESAIRSATKRGSYVRVSGPSGGLRGVGEDVTMAHGRVRLEPQKGQPMVTSH